MRHEAMQSERRKVRDTRFVLAVLLALSMGVNAVLSHGLAQRESMAVLVPAVSGPAWTVGETWAGRRYVEDTARTVVVTLLTLTPENAVEVREAAARMSHASARGEIAAWVETEAARLKRRDLSSAFYPLGIEVATDELAAEVTGELVTWLGREEATPHEEALPTGVRHGGRAHRVIAVRGTGGRRVKSAMRRIAVKGTPGGAMEALGLLLIIYMGSGATASALQILEASDHAELTAEISDSDVNRIALDGDRVSRVIQSPGGFTVEHDAVRGDLYLYPESASFTPAGAPAPVTLYLGTEQGFTYRLSLTVVSRDSAQILIRNAAVTATPVDRVRTVGGDRRGELVSLVLAVARREPVAGYVIVPAPESTMNSEQGSLMELWRGPRFTARVLRTSAEDAEQLARLSGAPVAAAWISAPGHGPNGERIAVLVEQNDRTEPVQ